VKTWGGGDGPPNFWSILGNETMSKLVSSARLFGGMVKQFTHESVVTKTPMRYSVFVPAGGKGSLPVLYYLSGLTCTDENFTHKAGAAQHAAKHNIILVAPDTSPRRTGEPLKGEDDEYDFGSGAGFYVNATQHPWANEGGYSMDDYINQELPAVVREALGGSDVVCPDRKSIFGHSMGGHGALTCALRNPGTYQSCSAFAPISNPTHPKCAWGQKAFEGYLGSVEAGSAYDATELAHTYNGPSLNVLMDTGTGDNFYEQGQLLPEHFVAAAAKNSWLEVESRMQEGYDHSYNFISTFVGDHIDFHSTFLNK
jgi:S-formylglutathione hydrolase